MYFSTRILIWRIFLQNCLWHDDTISYLFIILPPIMNYYLYQCMHLSYCKTVQKTAYISQDWNILVVTGDLSMTRSFVYNQVSTSEFTWNLVKIPYFAFYGLDPIWISIIIELQNNFQFLEDVVDCIKGKCWTVSHSGGKNQTR